MTVSNCPQSECDLAWVQRKDSYGVTIARAVHEILHQAGPHRDTPIETVDPASVITSVAATHEAILTARGLFADMMVDCFNRLKLTVLRPMSPKCFALPTDFLRAQRLAERMRATSCCDTIWGGQTGSLSDNPRFRGHHIV